MDTKTRDDILSLLTDDLGDVPDITKEQPILSHYTSIFVVEQFLAKRCLWMSNPLNMNDNQEVQFGIHGAMNAVGRSDQLRQAFGDKHAHSLFLSSLSELYDDYGEREVKNLFVACFSKHDANDFPNGKLSMWRGYGDQGNGAAIMLDTSKIELRDDTPFILSSVSYLSNEERSQRIDQKVDQLAEIVVEKRIEGDDIPELAYLFFRRAVLAAVFTKHIGFEEEQEWRLAYFPDNDQAGIYESMISYHVGPFGLEPKLKLRLENDDEASSIDIRLQKVVSEILIGPRSNSPLSVHAAKIMLRKLGHEELIPKLHYSKIPFRG